MTRKLQLTVTQQGIRFQKQLYWHPDLAPFIRQKVTVLHTNQAYTPTITVLCNGRFICEASPVIRLTMLEDDKLKLIHHLEEQNMQARMLSRRIALVRLRLKRSALGAQRYDAVGIPDAKALEPSYAPAIDMVANRHASPSPPLLLESAEALSAKDALLNNFLRQPKETPITDVFAAMGEKLLPNNLNSRKGDPSDSSS